MAGPLWVEKEFADAELDNMLPYVKQYLQFAANHRRFAVNSAELSCSNIYRFQCDAEPLSFCISEIDLYLFFNGVGCIAIEVKPVPNETGPITIEQVETLHSRMASLVRGTPFVMVRPESGAWSAQSDSKHPCANRDVLQFGEEPVTLRQLLQQYLLKSFQDGEGRPQYTPMVDRFLPIYGAILLEPHMQDSMEGMDRRFFAIAERHLTILRKTFPANDISNFSRIHLNDPEHHYMPYHNVIHTQSLDGGFILAYDNGLPHFNGAQSSAMASFRTNYFYMMLIPYHQRLSILRYATDAANAALSPRRGAALRVLREQINDFTSRCYFSQASVSEERDNIYRRWQKAFNVQQMYNELKEEVHDIDNYLAALEREQELEQKNAVMRRDTRNMKLFSLVTLVFLPITIVLQSIQVVPVLQRWINFSSHPERSVFLTVGMTAFVAILLLSILRFIRRVESMDS